MIALTIEERDMCLIRPFSHTLAARAQRDPAFRSALLIEATDAFLGGDIDTGKALLRDYTNATAALPTIAGELNLNEKSLRRILCPAGNPTLKKQPPRGQPLTRDKNK